LELQFYLVENSYVIILVLGGNTLDRSMQSMAELAAKISIYRDTKYCRDINITLKLKNRNEIKRKQMNLSEKKKYINWKD